MKRSCSCHCRPENASRHRIQIYDSPEWEDVTTKVTFVMTPTTLYSDNIMRRGIDWEVRLRVKTTDLPRLMREGFHWTTANLCPEATYLEPRLREQALTRIGWTCSRNYYLSDLGSNPYWAAKLIVCARNTEVLSRFKITNLRPHMVSLAFAWDDRTFHDRGFSYSFELHHPEQNYNTIYNDFPLEGWWPWPKRQDVGGTEICTNHLCVEDSPRRRTGRLDQAPGFLWEVKWEVNSEGCPSVEVTVGGILIAALSLMAALFVKYRA